MKLHVCQCHCIIVSIPKEKHDNITESITCSYLGTALSSVAIWT